MTKARFIKVDMDVRSKFGDLYDILYFTDLVTGHSLKTYAYHKCRNYMNKWVPVLKNPGCIIENFIILPKYKGIINADSDFRLRKDEPIEVISGENTVSETRLF